MIYTETSVTRYLEKWAADNLGDHQSPAYLKYHEAFSRHLLTKRAEQSEEHSNNGKFGMAKAGGCLRATAFSWAGVPREPLSGSTQVTFEVGHLLECMTLALLEASGFKLQGTQVVCDLPPAHYSYADGVLLSGPVELPYPLVLSVKTSSFKMSGKNRDGSYKRYGFCSLPLDGVCQGQYEWYVQAQLEMAALNIPNTIVLVVAKDMVKTMENDPIMQESGSLSFYAEVLDRVPGFEVPYQEMGGETLQVLRDILAEAGPGEAERAAAAVLPIVSRPGRFVRLPSPGDVASGWGGENQKACGDFNRCNGCSYAERCRA
jgi:hypothetical protein